MTWQFVFRETYSADGSNAAVRFPIVFEPLHRVVIKADLLSGLSANTRSIGKLSQLLFVDGFGDVTGNVLSLPPGYQLLTPSTEFSYRLLFQPLAKRFHVEISLWVDTNIMPITNPSAPNYPVSTVAASTTVPSSATSVPILAANTGRKGATVWNASTATLYLDVDGVVTATDYAIKLDPGGYYEVPYGFQGALSGIWSAVNGSALVREYT